MLGDVYVNPTAYVQEDLKRELDHYIVVEYKRYDFDVETGTPDGWVFYALTPDKDGSEQPFDEWDTPYEECHFYRGRVDGWMGEDLAHPYQRSLGALGFTEVPWAEAPEEFRGYVMGCVVPIEWHGDEPFIAGRVTIHLKGEWPS